MTDSPNLGLPYLEASQAQKHVTHNEALRRLDTLVQMAVIDRTLTAPPVSPVDGDSYIPAIGAAGAWAGHALEIASWQDGAWVFYPTSEGWRVWSAAEDALLAWNGTAWVITGGAALLNPTPLVGVNATADTTNRLSVSSPASLFNHEGAGHQLKVNKNTAADTASLLLQTGFSGRAEMGTTGEDDFHIKVSPDGSTWHEAMIVDRTTGEVEFPNTTFGGGGVSDGDKGDITVSSSGATWTIDNNAVSDEKLRDSAALSVIGRSANSTGDPADIAAGSDGQVLRRSGTSLAFGAVDLASANAITGDLPFANLTQGSARSVLGVTGNATADVASIQGTADQVLVVNGAGTALAFGAVATGSVANDAVTFAKMQNIATDRLVGRDTAAAGDPEEIAVNGGLEFGGSGNIQRSALTGDVTASAGSNATTIANDAVTNAKAANMAVNTIKGRITSGTGDPEDLTAAQVRTIINVADGANNYVHPNHSGDVTSVADGATTIANDAVTFAKMQNIATDRLLGRDTAATGDPEELTAGGGIEFTGSGGIQTSAFTGDVTKSAGGTALTIASNAVTNAKLADMATATIKGRVTAATGDPEDLTGTQATTLLDTFTSALKGLVPASGGGTTNFLRADGTFAPPPGAGGGEANTASNVGTAGVGVFKQKTGVDLEFKKINAGSSKITITDDTGNNEVDIDVAEASLTLANLGGSIDLSGSKASGTLAAARFPALTGDVTTTAGALAATIANDAVTNAKLADMATATFKGRTTAGTGDPEDLSVAQAKSLLNLTGTNSGDQTITLTSDVTGSGTGSFATTIANNAVTNAKAADMATATFKGRTTAGTGDPEDLSVTQATALLNALVGDSGSGGTKGLVPAPAAGDAAAAKFLKANGTWAVPAATPGGSDTQIQYNDGGAFNGSSDFTFNDTTGEVAFGKWLRLAEQASDPSNPSNGDILFAKKLANRRLPRFAAPLGFGGFVQPFLGEKKIAYWSASGNSNAAMTNTGWNALTSTGTLTARSVATTNILTRTRRLGHVSSALAGSATGARAAIAQWTVGDGSGLGGFFFSAIFTVSDASIVTGGRVFVGMQASTSAPTDVEPSTLVNCVGVGCRSSDTNLFMFYGGSAAQTPVDLGSSFPSDTTNTDLYRLCLFSSPSENGIIYYEVTRLNTGDVATGTISGTVGTVVPASTTFLTTNNYRSNGGTASAVGIDISAIYIETEQ